MLVNLFFLFDIRNLIEIIIGCHMFKQTIYWVKRRTFSSSTFNIWFHKFDSFPIKIISCLSIILCHYNMGNWFIFLALLLYVIPLVYVFLGLRNVIPLRLQFKTWSDIRLNMLFYIIDLMKSVIIVNDNYHQISTIVFLSLL